MLQPYRYGYLGAACSAEEARMSHMQQDISYELRPDNPVLLVSKTISR
jgi:hypothetical protein